MRRLFVLGVALLAITVITGIRAAYAAVYLPPVGGWTYIYMGDAAGAGATDNYDSLDGTWDHNNGADQWDGTGIGAGRPGGVSTLKMGQDTFLRLQDTGDPREFGFGDPGSNRKLMFAHSTTNDLGSAANTALDDGITVSFRARIATGPPVDDVHPDGGGAVVPWPAGGNGYVTHDGGKGNFGIRQSSGDKLISFALALSSDDDELTGQQGLVMNKRNGTVPTGDVDLYGSEPGTLNLLVLDPTEWHEFWIIIQADSTGVGTHLVRIYRDGAVSSPDDFIVTAGTGKDYDDSYIAMGLGATAQDGAFDVDFFAYKAGVTEPIPEPTTVTFLILGAAALAARGRRRRPIP